MDGKRIGELLRKLSPRQEKVIRLYFGLGCQRSHSAREMAQEFGVSAQVIAGILGAAQRRMAREGVTSSQLREAARRIAELDPASHLQSSAAYMTKSMRGPHSHRRR
jgi:DNA-directed RNA polymerase sigma subunit (sigma70/sigma32)